MTFADRLRQLREERGMTQAGLAAASGLPLGSIRNYEQGQREPYWAVVFKLAAALGVSCDKFRDCVPEALATELPTKRAKASTDAPNVKPAAKKGRKKKGK
jgi:transcriptional regulator with XRE-family HTH domain